MHRVNRGQTLEDGSATKRVSSDGGCRRSDHKCHRHYFLSTEKSSKYVTLSAFVQRPNFPAWVKAESSASNSFRPLKTTLITLPRNSAESSHQTPDGTAVFTPYVVAVPFGGIAVRFPFSTL